MTPGGWKKAGDLNIGDRLFSKVHSEEEADCEITHMETELKQQYFGLNCENSHVEANGYWVSTFGITHNIPAAWMKILTRVVGVKAASRAGDYFNALLSRWNLI
jgi:hypothetical protein